MKIIQINCVYKEGSTGKIAHDIHKGLLSAGEESIVICGRRAKKEEGVYGIASEPYAKFNNLLSRITGVMYGGCYFSTEKIKRIIKKEKPDIVHLHCINGFFCNIFRLLEFLKKNNIKTVLTLHAEFMYTANCGHAGECDKWKNGCKNCSEYKNKLHSIFFNSASYSWEKMHSIYKNWDNLHVIACSNWIASRASQSGEMANRDIRVLHNGVDIDSIFYPRSDAKEKIQEEYKLPKDKKYILYVAPYFNSIKGFDLLMDLVRKSKDDSIHFVLVGDEYEGKEKNITVVGKVRNQDKLADLYSGSDVFVITSRNDNYPTVCLEANTCGTPVIGFDVGGVKETIAEGMGATVEFSNTDAMLEQILNFVKNEPSKDTIEKARYTHSKKRMLDEHIELYRSLL